MKTVCIITTANQIGLTFSQTKTKENPSVGVFYSRPALFAGATALWLQRALSLSFVIFAAREDFYTPVL